MTYLGCAIRLELTRDALERQYGVQVADTLVQDALKRFLEARKK